MRILPLVLLSLSLTACVGVSVGTDDEEFFRVRGLGTAYAAVPGIDDYDGKIIKLGVLTRSPGGGQIAGVEIWPLLKVGVGLVGAQVRVLPFEVGAGVLFYRPNAERRDLSKSKDKEKKGVVIQLDDVTDDGAAGKSKEGEDVPVRAIEPPPEKAKQ